MSPAVSPADNPLPAAPSVHEFEATVTEIREWHRIDGRPVFQVALDRSFFGPSEPEPGRCVGTLTATSRLGTVLVAPITSVHRDADGELWHTTVKPLQPGTSVVARVQPVAA